jgi:hypothetical protein
MTFRHAVDVDDTSRCPLGVRCESCGTERDDLTIATSCTDLGALCLTACPTCAAAISRGTPLPVSVATAARLVAQHSRHLGAGG